MSHQLTIEQKPGYLHIRVTGENSPEAVRDYLLQVAEACKEHKCSSALVEEHLRGPALGTVDIFTLASGASNRAREQSLRLAYVDVNPEHSFADMKFVETVAVNRGVNVRLFSSVSEADAWLRAAPGSEAPGPAKR